MSDGLRLVCSLVWKDNLGQLDRDEAHGFFEALYQIFGGVQMVLWVSGVMAGKMQRGGHWDDNLMPSEHASDIQLGNGGLGTLNIVSVAPGAAGYTTVYGNAAEVTPLQIAPAAALTAH